VGLRPLAGIAGSNPAGKMDVCLLKVFCCQVEISATGRSLVQRRPTECVCVCVCVDGGRGHARVRVCH
jgi:hypothetical protein